VRVRLQLDPGSSGASSNAVGDELLDDSNSVVPRIAKFYSITEVPDVAAGAKSQTAPTIKMATTKGGAVKEQLIDLLPKRFKGIKFGIQSNQDIVNQSVLEVSDTMLYDVDNERKPFKHGPLDTHLVCGSIGIFMEGCF
jgi:hypothetical protein